MTLPKTKLGDILHITFWDHSECDSNESHELLFEVFGRLVAENGVYYKIAIWTDPRIGGDENSEYFGIVKAACKTVKVIK